MTCGLDDGVVFWCFDCVLVLGGGGGCVFCEPGDVDASWCSDCVLMCSGVVGMSVVSCVCVDAAGVGVCSCVSCFLWYCFDLNVGFPWPIWGTLFVLPLWWCLACSACWFFVLCVAVCCVPRFVLFSVFILR